jgi:hypothetical protein
MDPYQKGRRAVFVHISDEGTSISTPLVLPDSPENRVVARRTADALLADEVLRSRDWDVTVEVFDGLYATTLSHRVGA